MSDAKISRSTLELFLQCPRCYYREVVQGKRRPNGIIPRLNLAVDAILKREFDFYRTRQQPHPLMTQYRVDGLPLQHPDLQEWREASRGIRCLWQNRPVYGAVDDVWQLRDGSLAVVDYKATSVNDPVSEVVGERQSNARQLEMYTWIFHQAGFHMADVGYLVIANADREASTLSPAWPVSLTVMKLPLDTTWVEAALHDLVLVEARSELPKSARDCPWCKYFD